MSERALRETPYKGLMPYSEEDEEFFFGRESDQEIIAANLMASRFTLLYGPSGVGKSSVLRAGVAADLRRQARQNLAARGKPRFIIIIFNEWKDAPLSGLLKQVRRAVKDSFAGQPFEPVPSNLSFDDELAAWAERAGGKLFVVLDQFEEYFLYPQAEGAGSFAVEFPRAVNRSDLRANFLISIREDWLAKLDRFKVDIPNLFDNYLRIERLDREAARSAIEQPVVKYNQTRQAEDPKVTIAEGFSARVLAQLEGLANKNVLGESGRGEVKGALTSEADRARIQTPYLQLVMIHLWKEAIESGRHELHPAMLDDPDRAEKIVQSHLNEVMERLDASEQEAASRVFDRLVTPSGVKIAQTLSDLAAFAELSKDEIAPMLDKLSQKESGILSQLAPPPGQRNEPRFEIFHDVLAPAILNWCTHYVQEQKDVEAERRAEEQRQRAEREARSAARFRRLAIGMALVSALALLFAGFAVANEFRAVAERRKAEEARAEANLARQGIVTEQRRALEAQVRAVIKESDAEVATFYASIARDNAATEQRKAEAERKQKEAQSRLALQRKAEAERVTQDLRGEQLYGQAQQQAITTDFEGAEPNYEQALKYFRQSGNIERQAATLYELGDVNRYMVDTVGENGGDAPAQKAEALARRNKTVGFLRESQQLYKRIGKHEKEEAQALSLLGELYEKTGNPEEAIRTYQEALPLIRKAGDRGLEMSTLEKLGGLYGETDKSNALEYYRQLVRLYEQNKAEFLESLFGTLKRMGEFYQELEQLAEARDAYEQASKNVPRSSNKEDAIDVLLSLGQVNYDLGERRQALKYYEDARRAISEYADHDYDGEKVLRLPDYLDYVNVVLGKIYAELNENQKALDYYQSPRILNQLRLSRDPNNLSNPWIDFETLQSADSFMNLSKIYSALGEKQKAEDSSQVAAQIYRALGKATPAQLNAAADRYKKFGNVRKAAELYRRAKEAASRNK